MTGEGCPIVKGSAVLLHRNGAIIGVGAGSIRVVPTAVTIALVGALLSLLLLMRGLVPAALPVGGLSAEHNGAE